MRRIFHLCLGGILLWAIICNFPGKKVEQISPKVPFQNQTSPVLKPKINNHFFVNVKTLLWRKREVDKRVSLVPPDHSEDFLPIILRQNEIDKTDPVLNSPRKADFRRLYAPGILIQNWNCSSMVVPQVSILEDQMTFNNCSIKNLNGYNFEGKVEMMSCNLNNSEFLGCNMCYLESANTNTDGITNIERSTLRGFSVMGNHFNKRSYFFRSDTLRNFFELSRHYTTYIKDTDITLTCQFAQRLDLVFVNCFVNAGFNMDAIALEQEIVFKNCTFGPNFKYFNVVADKVSFINCEPLPLGCTLQIKPGLSSANVYVQNTSVANANFHYSSSVRLFFANLLTEDDVHYWYRPILKKFQELLQEKPFRKMYNEYRWERAALGSLWQKIQALVSYVGHGYGLEPMRGVWWVLIMASCIFLFNSLMWNKYPLQAKMVVFKLVGPNVIKISKNAYGRYFSWLLAFTIVILIVPVAYYKLTLKNYPLWFQVVVVVQWGLSSFGVYCYALIVDDFVTGIGMSI